MKTIAKWFLRISAALTVLGIAATVLCVAFFTHWVYGAVILWVGAMFIASLFTSEDTGGW